MEWGFKCTVSFRGIGSMGLFFPGGSSAGAFESFLYIGFFFAVVLGAFYVANEAIEHVLTPRELVTILSRLRWKETLVNKADDQHAGLSRGFLTVWIFLVMCIHGVGC